MKILFMDDSEFRWRSFFRINISHELIWTATVEETIKCLESEKYDMIFLDHDMSEEDHNKTEGFKERTGLEVAKFLEDNPRVSPNSIVVVHTMNPTGRENMVSIMKGRIVVACPFNVDMSAEDIFIKISELIRKAKNE